MFSVAPGNGWGIGSRQTTRTVDECAPWVRTAGFPIALIDPASNILGCATKTHKLAQTVQELFEPILRRLGVKQGRGPLDFAG